NQLNENIILESEQYISNEGEIGQEGSDFGNAWIAKNQGKKSLDGDKIEIKVSLSDVKVEDIQYPNDGIYKRVYMDDCENIGQVGYPKLPTKTLKLLLPYGKDLNEVSVISGQEHILEGNYKIEPAQAQIRIGIDTIPDFTIDEVIYQSKQPHPDKPYSIVGVYELKGYRILILNIHPVKYIPYFGKITYFKDFIVQVNLVENRNCNSLFKGEEGDEKHVLETVDNPELVDTYTSNINLGTPLGSPLSLPPASYEYVIITNEALKNSNEDFTFQDLADYKESLGITTNITTVEYIYANYLDDDNQEKIRNFIIDAYNDWGTRYILLGGDGDGANLGGESESPIVPARGLYATAYGDVDSNIPSDLYYAGLDGTWNDDGDGYWGEPGEEDLYAEVYVGRAPVDSEEEVANFVRKTLIHEMINDPYLSKALMVGEDLFWPVWGADYKDEIKDGSNANGYSTSGFNGTDFTVDTLYDRDIDPDRWDKDDIIDLIEQEYHIINHLGHAANDYVMKMVNDDVDNLKNDKYFFGYSQGCYDGAFDNRDPFMTYNDYDCIVEHFVNMENGSFAFIGNSRYGWGDPFGTNGASQYYDRQFFDAIFKENIIQIGPANQDSKEDNINYIDQEAMRWCYYEINLFGDPTATLMAQPNLFEPALTSESVSPTSGDQTTLLTFNVEYTDADDNPPAYINVLINETSYPMEKQDSDDNYYMDGCFYEFQTHLQPGDYNYYFKCSDGKYVNFTKTHTDLTVSKGTNSFAPDLSNGQVNPNAGVNGTTLFEYTVLYTDVENFAPKYVNVSINSDIFPMNKQDYTDNNYMDGCLYTYSTLLDDPGVYSYSYICSDGDFPGSDGPYIGPHVTSFQQYIMLIDFPYNWIDASGGTELLLSDDGYSAQTLPFEFKFYEHNFSTIYVGSNGYLSFADSSPNEYIPQPIPSAYPSTHFLIAPHWADLDPDWGSGEIYVQSFDEYWVVSWVDIDHYFGERVGTFQVVLFESGDIVFNYDYISYIDSFYGYTCGLNLGVDTRFYNNYQGLTDTTDDFSIYFTCFENHYEPQLTNVDVNPTSGDQTTEFTFNVNYSDQDNNYPLYVNLIINDTVYPMQKQNLLDDDYTDGCIYQFSTYLQPGDYEYSFNCTDYLYSNYTKKYTDLTVLEKSNDNPPLLSDGQVNPPTGYKYYTLFRFSVIYTDVDNNAPEYINININSSTYPMIKQDYMDNNYMDGCLYLFDSILNEIGTYNYYFECYDGNNIDIDGPYSGPTVEKMIGIFDDLYINHLFSLYGIPDVPSSFRYSHESGEIYNVEWEKDFYGKSFWDIDKQTRIIEDCYGSLAFVDGSHTPAWIHTNVALNDIIPITVDGIGDHDFQITSQLLYDLPGVGIVEVWLLEDLETPGIAWYEKSTGILLDGTFYWDFMGYLYNYTFKFVDSNIEFDTVVNDYAPKLTDEFLFPFGGFQTTEFEFTVNYTDQDNNYPFYVNLVVNDTIYPMEKQNVLDDDYTDGCIYHSLIYLQPGLYEYFFTCFDGIFINTTKLFFGPLVLDAGNSHDPVLSNGDVDPDFGYVYLTQFEFSVIYTDLDNNAPEYVNLTINQSIFLMTKQDLLDNNYMDGCLYTY
ncbi:MAG: C25 family cysteine peptidase, partial [Candidatus Hodarchaeota archaeon]